MLRVYNHVETASPRRRRGRALCRDNVNKQRTRVARPCARASRCPTSTAKNKTAHS